MNANELAEIRETQNQIESPTVGALLAHIDEQDNRIAALKASHLNDRCELILCSPSYSLWRYQHDIDRAESDEDWKAIKTKAQVELTAEMPEIDWGDDQIPTDRDYQAAREALEEI